MECIDVRKVRGAGIGLVSVVRREIGTEDFVTLLLQDALKLRETIWLVPATVDENDE